jgi:hypothetical protein
MGILEYKAKTTHTLKKSFTSEAQVNSFVLKFLGSRSTFTATAQVITAIIRVEYFHIPSKIFTRIMAVIT